TGTFPYAGRSPQQVMIAHVTGTPNLAPLPECDRPAVAAALSKKPEDRFPLCQDFVRELIMANYTGPRSQSGAARPSGSISYQTRPVEMTPGPAELTDRHLAPSSVTVPDGPRLPVDTT